MATLQEIQADIARLKRIAQNKREIEELGEERRQAERELKRLKSPRLTRFKKSFVRGNVRLGKALISGGKQSAKILGQAAQNIVEAERQEELAKRRRARAPTKKKPTKAKRTPTRKRTTKTKKSTSRKRR